MLSAPKFLIGLEPKEAVDFLHQKKLLASKVFKKELYDSALARATTIARLDSLEMTKDIYASLESAVKNGISFSQWKKDIMAEFERKGWVFAHDKKVSRGIDGKQLADPKTGEYFGTPRRLNTIFRVNTQAAYSAGRYQRLMDNVDNRPYWQYSAVGDNRTRPAHMALHGRIYRYDAPFWATFYPPNGFNCRCTVIALSDRDLTRQQITPDDSSANLVEVQRPADKQGNTEKTVGFKLPDGSIRTTDKGFDYNIGRLSYRPNLDLYPEKLAHQFAKVEMIGGEFLHNFKRLKKEIESIKDVNQLNGKLTTEQVVNIRNKLSFNFKFAAGVLSKESKTKINAKTSTVWLSDDTLIKQFNSREGQDFNANEYSDLPDMINTPDYLLPAKDFHDRYMFIKKGKMLVLKVLENELFILSFRKMRNKELEKLLNK
ncbi:phage head morphogenesis protein, SPP1 gp7 family [[Actinobacillus] rossii]|uniref:Phage head morphogenesis protein, SPP1 gp7 family n=1 Tax=[Actinobacillus] rossii TaxID=123820 RepID=A0A380TUN5_9PAST|nr:phage head morphogenesis protein, SPP1 gp7 family [[Actinobacillus] rossii]